MKNLVKTIQQSINKEYGEGIRVKAAEGKIYINYEENEPFYAGLNSYSMFWEKDVEEYLNNIVSKHNFEGYELIDSCSLYLF